MNHRLDQDPTDPNIRSLDPRASELTIARAGRAINTCRRLIGPERAKATTERSHAAA